MGLCAIATSGPDRAVCNNRLGNSDGRLVDKVQIHKTETYFLILPTLITEHQPLRLQESGPLALVSGDGHLYGAPRAESYHAAVITTA